MALTRKMLKAMGIEDEKIDQIIEAHTETVDALKEKAKTYEEKAGQLEAVEKELDGYKANASSDYKAKYESEHKAFEDYKKEQTAKQLQTQRENAAKKFFESKNITGANLDIAMRGARDEISALELDGENIKDNTALDSLVKGMYSGLVVTKSVEGAKTSTPPATENGSAVKSKAEILAIKDTTERQKEWKKYITSQNERK